MLVASDEKDGLRGRLPEGNLKEKVFYEGSTAQRCVTNSGLTSLQGFHPVRHTLSGPDGSALPTPPRHTAFQTEQPTYDYLSRV